MTKIESRIETSGGNKLVSTLATGYMRLPEGLPPLLECPCCGGEAEFRSLHACWVQCTVCGLSTPAYEDPDVAARAWNGGIHAVEVVRPDGLKIIDAKPTDSNRREHTKDTMYLGPMTEQEYNDARALKAYRESGFNAPTKSQYEMLHPKVGRPMIGDEYVPKYVPTGRPPGRPRKNPMPDKKTAKKKKHK